MKPNIFNPRAHSLLRGSALVLISLGAALVLSPTSPATEPLHFYFFPALIAATGTADTVRCMRSRWSFYHGGVLLLVYMDLMALCMILFFLLTPTPAGSPPTNTGRDISHTKLLAVASPLPQTRLIFTLAIP